MLLMWPMIWRTASEDELDQREFDERELEKELNEKEFDEKLDQKARSQQIVLSKFMQNRRWNPERSEGSAVWQTASSPYFQTATMIAQSLWRS